MKTIFKKVHIPFIKHVVNEGNGRDNWTLARLMQENDGLQHQIPAEIFLLQRGANCGDAWSMCELARTYFHHCGDIFLPHALKYWKLAILQDDYGAKQDLKNLPIYDRILEYCSPDWNRYTAIEIKCAMLIEWYLTKLGSSPWESIDKETRLYRCKEFIKAICPILSIPDVGVSFEPNLHFQGRLVDGLAGWDKKISIREEILEDFERLIVVVMHELGHIVTYEIRSSVSIGIFLKDLYGITEERVRSWNQNEMGYEVITSEEDPDTLSYGVYTMWATFFATN